MRIIQFCKKFLEMTVEFVKWDWFLCGEGHSDTQVYTCVKNGFEKYSSHVLIMMQKSPLNKVLGRIWRFGCVKKKKPGCVSEFKELCTKYKPGGKKQEYEFANLGV